MMVLPKKPHVATKPSPYLDPCINLGKYFRGPEGNTEVKKSSATDVPRSNRTILPQLPTCAPKLPRGNRWHPRKKVARKRTVCDALKEMGDGESWRKTETESEQSSVLKQLNVELDRAGSLAKDCSPYLAGVPIRSSTRRMNSENKEFLLPQAPEAVGDRSVFGRRPFFEDVKIVAPLDGEFLLREYIYYPHLENEELYRTDDYDYGAAESERTSECTEYGAHIQTPVFFSHSPQTIVRSDSPSFWFFPLDEEAAATEREKSSSLTPNDDERLGELMQSCVIRKERHPKQKQSTEYTERNQLQVETSEDKEKHQRQRQAIENKEQHPRQDQTSGNGEQGCQTQS